jgi:hypothetical protein
VDGNWLGRPEDSFNAIEVRLLLLPLFYRLARGVKCPPIFGQEAKSSILVLERGQL